MSRVLIEVRSASVIRGGRRLLDGVSLTGRAGEVTAVLGPNGAGKSTLLRLMAGEHAPDAGAVLIDGTPLDRMPARHAAARRAVLPQASTLAFPFTVREIAALGLEVPGFGLSHAEITALIARALDAVDLAGHAGRSHDALSGGERQRAHLARVLCQLWAGERATGPGILLLDEPTAAQDLAHQLRVLEVARAHADGGGAAVIILHDLNLAARYADRMLVISRGQVAAEGRPAEVLTAEMLAEVFGVRLVPGAVPEKGRPFILPQMAERL